MFDPVRARPLLVAGVGCCFFDDTWELASLAPASYRSFGSGCPGPAGTPRLAAVPYRLPWLGDVFEIELTRLVPGESAWIALGSSNAVWGAVPLPFALGAAGMPGCTLLASLDVLVPVANVAGVAALALELPADPAFAGLDLHTQGWTTAPTANPTGLIVSNGATARIGQR